MILDSRRILSFFRQVYIYAISQLQHAEKKAHQPVCVGFAFHPTEGEYGEKTARTDDEKTTEKPDSPRHEETCGMKGTTIKQNPDESHERCHFRSTDCDKHTQTHTCRQRRR